MLILSLLKFLIFLIFFLYIPSKIIFKFLKLKTEDKLVEVSLTLIFGIVLITLVSFAVRYIGISLSLLWAIFALSVLYLIFNLNLNRFTWSLKKIKLGTVLVLLVILVGVIGQNLVLFRGGWKVASGLVFPSLHDSMWNISLSSELFNHFPPQNPAMAGELLKNNHYFYPFFLSIVRYFSGIEIFDLYFRFGPILVSTLFGLGLYAVSSIYTKSIIFRGVAIFLGYFSGNFSYLLPFIFGTNFDWKGNTFFADQPFDQLINPYSVLGFTLMLFGIYCLSQIKESKKDSYLGYSIVGGLLLGSLYGFKSFGGVAVILSLGLTAFTAVTFYQKLYLLPITGVSFILFLFIFFFTTNPAKASLVWAPGWLLTQLMTDKDKLNLPQFADMESFYQSIGNRLGFLKIKTIELAIYFIGNLGTRVAGFIYILIKLLRKAKDPQKNSAFLFIAFITIISLSIPLFFNLKNSTFNIIQFTPYALVLLAIASTIFLEKFYYFMYFNGKRVLGVILILIFIILSVPVNVKNVLEKLEMPKDMIINEEIEALNFLRKDTNIQDIVLINPESFSQDPIYIPAISERRVYLASLDYSLQTGLDPKSRLDEMNEFFKFGSREFLTKNNITYIYHMKINPSDTQVGFMTKLGLETVFQNNKVIIWRIKG